jgi:hypothetical protein
MFGPLEVTIVFDLFPETVIFLLLSVPVFSFTLYPIACALAMACSVSPLPFLALIPSTAFSYES